MDERTMRRPLVAACALLIAVSTPGSPRAETRAQGQDAQGPYSPRYNKASAIAESTWVDNDGRPIPEPPAWQPSFYGRTFRVNVVDPLSHIFDIPDKLLLAAKPFGVSRKREAVDVNAFDEVPNSTWFTNRNHVRAVPVGELRMGPDSTLLPEKPWTIKHVKHGGASAGFQIKDAAGRKWLVKVDWRGYPRLSSGADMVARTLLHAAGYSVPHNEPVGFVRGDLTIDKELLRGKGHESFTTADLDSVLARGALLLDGSYSATASLFISGHVLGSPSLSKRRPGDPNDWYSHPNRRELRGLYVLCSWIGFWDTKDGNFLDTFVSTGDSLGHVEHYILDPGSSLGADADGLKRVADNYENMVDFGWAARRLVTLGFVVEPWRRAHQDTGIPSVGRFESEVFNPGTYAPEVPQTIFREMTEGDAYWGAKVVASFSDAQIAAAVEAAHYEDPRAREFLVRNLIVRRDKIAKYWFGRVAPLDFFAVHGDELSFHDLAVDIGLSSARAYDVVVESEGKGARTLKRVHLAGADLPLQDLGSGDQRVRVKLSIAGDRAKPARVELTRTGAKWAVTRVRHG